MSHLTRIAYFALFVLCVTGCAFSPVERPDLTKFSADIQHERSLTVAPSSAIAIAKSAAEAMGYEIQSVTPELGQVRTKVKAVNVPDVCDCGTWNYDDIRGTADSSLVVRVTAAGSQSTVTLEHTCSTKFTGQNLNGATTRVEAYQCASKGIVEKEFWSTVEKIEKARAGAPGA
jgi:hypothetical protein